MPEHKKQKRNLLVVIDGEVQDNVHSPNGGVLHTNGQAALTIHDHLDMSGMPETREDLSEELRDIKVYMVAYTVSVKAELQPGVQITLDTEG